jgi:ketosteroid isomerase-like protein
MSEENVDVLRRFIDASNRRDLTAVLSCCDPGIEIESGRVLTGTPTYRGRDGIERWFRDMAAACQAAVG